MINNSKSRLQNQMTRQRSRWHESLMASMLPKEEVSHFTEINVGQRLHELRTAQGLSIRYLAKMSGLNFNTLSLIENEKTSPNVSTLQQLAKALQVPVTAFFEQTRVYKDVVFQKVGERPRTILPHGTLEDLGAGLTLGEGTPLLLTLEAGANSGPDVIVHTGQEFVYCLEGSLVYSVGEKEYYLDIGDSLIFEAYIPHRWENRGNTLSRSTLIICPSDASDRLAEKHLMNNRIEK
ncbi:MAG: helix-turn-helix domain-containing protein [Pelolinea sp.]|nr:helix-turn-helix domain-containing protein [Pelolinea sp.]